LYILPKNYTFDTYDYCKIILLLYVLKNIGISALKMAITPKRVGAN